MQPTPSEAPRESTFARHPPWRQRPLGSICNRVVDRNSRGEANVLTISAEHGLIRQSEYFKRVVASHDLSNYFLLKAGDFAYNKSYSSGYPAGAIRRLDRYPAGVVSPLYICFRPSSPDIHSDFLRHYFAAGRADEALGFLAKEGARNHGLLNVAIDDFLGIAIDLPPLPEQQRIAEILDTIDDAIRAAERLIAKLELIKRGLLHDLMTMGISKDGELRSRRTHRFMNSAVGSIPEEWTVLSLGSVATRITNGFVGIATPHYTDSSNGVPYLYGNNIRENKIDEMDVTFVTRSFHNRNRKSQLLPGDMLTVQSGHIGTTAIVPTGFSESNCHALIITKFKQGAAIPEFVGAYCNFALNSGRLSHLFVGSTIKHINTSEFAKFSIPFPPLDEQRRIYETLDTHERQAAGEREELGKLVELKQGLMDDLLTGRVRIPIEAVA
jgi:type I restriction enzyme S subunit